MPGGFKSIFFITRLLLTLFQDVFLISLLEVIWPEFNVLSSLVCFMQAWRKLNSYKTMKMKTSTNWLMRSLISSSLQMM